MNALTLFISTAFQELRQPLTKLFVQDGGSILLVTGTEASGVRSGVIELFPKDENRETEVCQGFRFFASGWTLFVRK